MGLVRRALLAASRSQRLQDRALRYRFVRRAVSRFMPGETLEEALIPARGLADRGIATVFTLLGENITEPAASRQVADHYREVLRRVAELGLDGQISVKPTQLGVDLSAELCHENLGALVDRAAESGTTVWIDMEDSSYTDVTLDLYRRLRGTHANVGVCLQAYLRRAAADLESLLPLGPAIRLVKGAYLEPAEIAFPSKDEVDGSYLDLAERLLAEAGRDGTRVAFGTHDRKLIERINAAAAAGGVGREAYEWQLLYGIQRAEQQRLAREGYRVRVLISYGAAWYPWYVRRLAERPANLLFVAKNLFAR
jgi:proline dehydrogenase